MTRNITVTFEDGSSHVYQNAPDNLTPDDVINRASKEFGMSVANVDGGRKESPSPQEAQQKPNTVGRQLGLTARHIIEGGSELVGIASDPIAIAMTKAGLPTPSAGDTGRAISDKLGLPSPQNPTERVVASGSKMMVGAGGTVKAAAKAGTGAISKALASNPAMQVTSSAGSGTAAGVAKENGAGSGGQFAAAVAGGLGVPLLTSGAKAIINSIRRISTNPTNSQIDDVVRQAGVDVDSMPSHASAAMRRDIKAALATDADVSPDALRRLADYKTVGATPTKGSLTLKPADVTRDKNLAKVGANSSDPAAQELANVANKNNSLLIKQVNDLGAESADDAITAGGKIISAIEAKNAQAKTKINSLYNKARGTDGRGASLDHIKFTNAANDLLDENLLGGKLPSDVRNLLNKTASGDMPLTVDVAEQLKTRIGDLQRASRDGAERLALSKVRQALDDTPLLEGQGEEAITAFNNARRANASYMQKVEATPALKAVRDGVEPDKFVQTFIVGNGSKSNIADIKALRDIVSDDPNAMQTIKEQIVAHLKNKAVNGRADEVANLSPASYNKALKEIGDMKLDLFFSRKEIDLLKTVGRVASYEKVQPVGSAVNNSNTASSVAGLLDWISSNSVIRKVPLAGNMIANDAANISTGLGARNTLNSAKSIATKANSATKQKTVPLSLLLAPSIAVE